MLQIILVAATVIGAIVVLVWLWKLSDKWKEIILEKIYGEKSTKNLDVDNLLRFLMVMVGMVPIWTPIVLLMSSINTTTFNPEEKNKTISAKSFREFLIDQNENIDIKISNKFESLSSDNKYSNHYFNFSTVLPEDFQVDRGNFTHTIIRCFKEDQGVVISINVTPLTNISNQREIEQIHESFQESPLFYLDEKFNGNFKSHILSTLKSNTNLDVMDLEVGVKKIRSTNYVYTKASYLEMYDGVQVEIVKLDYLTILWGNSFGFIYNSPKGVFNEGLINEILFHNNFVKPF